MLIIVPGHILDDLVRSGSSCSPVIAECGRCVPRDRGSATRGPVTMVRKRYPFFVDGLMSSEGVHHVMIGVMSLALLNVVSVVQIG